MYLSTYMQACKYNNDNVNMYMGRYEKCAQIYHSNETTYNTIEINY